MCIAPYTSIQCIYWRHYFVHTGDYNAFGLEGTARVIYWRHKWDVYTGDNNRDVYMVGKGRESEWLTMLPAGGKSANLRRE